MDDVISDVLSTDDRFTILLDDEFCVAETVGDNFTLFTNQEHVEDEQTIVGLNAADIIPFFTRIKQSVIDTENHDMTHEKITKKTSGKKQVLVIDEDGLRLQHTQPDGTIVNLQITGGDISTETSELHSVLHFRPSNNGEIPLSQYKSLLHENVSFIGEIVSHDTVTKSMMTPETNNTNKTMINNTENIFESVHPNDKDEFSELIRQIVSEKERGSLHCRFKSDNGEWRMFEVNTHLKQQYPFSTSHLVTAHDVTTRYLFEQRREVINRVLRHDLRNEMNVIHGHAQFLTDVDNETVKNHAETIKNKAEYLVSLGEEVRSIDQDLNRTNRRTRQVNAQRVINEEVEKLHDEYSEVTFRVSSNEVFIIANSLFRTAIHHVLENAIEHNNKEESDIVVRITCSYEEKDDMVEICVMDNGPGIPQGELDVINSGVETQLKHVSGLGLWMVKWVMESINGTVKFEDNENVGSGTKVVMRMHSSSFTGTSDDGSPDPLESSHSSIKDIASPDRDDSEIKTTTRD